MGANERTRLLALAVLAVGATAVWAAIGQGGGERTRSATADAGPPVVIGARDQPRATVPAKPDARPAVEDPPDRVGRRLRGQIAATLRGARRTARRFVHALLRWELRPTRFQRARLARHADSQLARRLTARRSRRPRSANARLRRFEPVDQARRWVVLAAVVDRGGSRDGLLLTLRRRARWRVMELR